MAASPLAAGRDAPRRENVAKAAFAFLAVQQQAAIGPVGQRQGVLPLPPFGLA